MQSERTAQGSGRRRRLEDSFSENNNSTASPPSANTRATKKPRIAEDNNDTSSASAVKLPRIPAATKKSTADRSAAGSARTPASKDTRRDSSELAQSLEDTTHTQGDPTDDEDLEYVDPSEISSPFPVGFSISVIFCELVLI